MSSSITHKKIAGENPERQRKALSGIETLWHNYASFYGSLLTSSQKSYNKILKTIRALGQQLSKLDDPSLNEAVGRLRRDLRLHGISDKRACLSFALVREMSDRFLGMGHYDTQLTGGWAVLQGKVAEMQTGEGKTLTATLPACTMALAGFPTQIVTFNEYLAERDYSLMKPLYDCMGINVGLIKHGMATEERRQAYHCNVVYCTSKELIFDYLKDHLVNPQRSGRITQAVQRLYGGFGKTGNYYLRGLHYVIVDEADGVLIDEARTPLVISGDGNNVFEEEVYSQAIMFARKLKYETDFIIDIQRKKTSLTDNGKIQSEKLTSAVGGFWNVTRMREMLLELALEALHCFERDSNYCIEDGKVGVIDETTGKIAADRSWESGLQQMIESKEGCPVTTQRDTLARITFQRFFRRYNYIGGLTSTAREARREFWSVYNLKVVEIPTNKPIQRQGNAACSFAKSEKKLKQIVRKTEELNQTGRPVLIGTPSVEEAEQIGRQLTQLNLDHRMLSGIQPSEEAEILAVAGQRGRITIAVIPSGRGVHIELGAGVVDSGGLHVIVSEKSIARRIDRQLVGKCGCLGNPGTFSTYVSLDDDLFQSLPASSMKKLLLFLLDMFPGIGQYATSKMSHYLQKKAERKYYHMRKGLLKSDESMERYLAFSGEGE